MNSVTVVVLMGGPDAERDVSLMSGSEIAAALRRCERFHVIDQVVEKPNLPELQALVGDADVVFPALHGRWGEGGPLQELLDQLGTPYVGSRPTAARLAMDKLVTKSLLSEMGVPTPPARQLMSEDTCDLDPPLVLKPVDDGSSVDLRICHTPQQVVQARRELHPKRGRLLAERYISGRELTVGVLCGEPLPVIEVIPAKSVEFYDYEAKYTRDDTSYVVSPTLPQGVAEQIQGITLAAFNRLGCRDVARADFMLDERGPWFLEINTLPGFTTHSLVPMAARSIGLEMPELCAKLVDAALARRGQGDRARPAGGTAAPGRLHPSATG